MAAIGFVLGSVIGCLAATVGWLTFDLSVLSAFCLYLATGFGIGCAVSANALIRAVPAHAYVRG